MNALKLTLGAAAVASLLLAPAMAAAKAPTNCGGGDTLASKKDIVETADAAGTFKTLLAAAAAAGLVDTLKSEGPFTVFAPSDAAFAKLPKGAVEGLLKDKAKLRAVLTYHVVSGKVMAHAAKGLDSAKTVQGQELKLQVKDGALHVNQAKVVAADIRASNGVIHVIDQVIMPPAGKRTAQR